MEDGPPSSDGDGAEIADAREGSDTSVNDDDSEDDETDSETVALGRATIQQFEHYIKLNKKIASEVMVSVNQLEDTSKIVEDLQISCCVNE